MANNRRKWNQFVDDLVSEFYCTKYFSEEFARRTIPNDHDIRSGSLSNVNLEGKATKKTRRRKRSKKTITDDPQGSNLPGSSKNKKIDNVIIDDPVGPSSSVLNNKQKVVMNLSLDKSSSNSSPTYLSDGLKNLALMAPNKRISEKKVPTPSKEIKTPMTFHIKKKVDVIIDDSPGPSSGVPKNKKKELMNSNPNKSDVLGNLSQMAPHKKISEKNVSTFSKEISTSISFHIKRVENPQTGVFIRCRNSKYKYINIKSFISPKMLSYVFCTKSKNTVENELVSSFKELNMEEYSLTKSVSKKLSRKRGGKRHQKEKSSKDSDNTPFPDYITLGEVNTGLKDGTLIKGFMRVNPKNPRDSYVSNEDSSKADYYLTSVLDRNRAFDGDEVILKIKPANEWIDGKKTVSVVYIKEKVHPRICVGTLKHERNKNNSYANFHPRDKRCPCIRIPETCWPNGFKEQPAQFTNIILVAKVLKWPVPQYASGIVTECLGQSGDLKVETLSIIREFCLDITPFTEEVKTECLPETLEIPQNEFEYREDIRRDCIFTIDPETARDLDDAVSVKTLTNGNYEVGVHISDASFYLEQGTELDQLVCRKATTIYMVNEVFHMLPVELCLFCSLLPGEDKLSFSVFWEMTHDGEVINKRFAKTIMNSCAKLAYEHAQMVIENPDKEFTSDDFPTIHNNYNPSDIVHTIKVLQKIATNLRQKRLESGALKIDQVKLLFKLDPATGEPLEFWKYENKEAHRLIEEFMLLANITVARKIYESFPSLAFLRCHQCPKQTMLFDLQNSLATCGIHLDISSSGGISSSLKKYITHDYAGFCRSIVLNHLTAKAMTRAKYYCSATPDSELDFKHYALSVPIYTHFTSPIRRYADIMVHRLLAASLEYQDPPKWTSDYVSAVAANCNAQKYNAKRAGEASCELYLSHYVEKHKPFEADCVVVDVKEKSFDCIVLNTGSTVRIYNNNCELGTTWETESIPIVQKNQSMSEKKLLKLTISFPKTRQYPATTFIVEMFTLVKIILDKKPNSYKLEGTLLRPITGGS